MNKIWTETIYRVAGEKGGGYEVARESGVRQDSTPHLGL